MARITGGRISGLPGPRVPMPEAEPGYFEQQKAEAEMRSAAAVYEQMQREIRQYGRTLDDGNVLTMPKPEGLGPIASLRMATGDIAPQPQPGSGDRRRMKPASAMDKATSKAKKAVDATLGPIGAKLRGATQGASDAISYFAGPHAADALGRTAEAGQTGLGYVPGLGDMMDISSAATSGVDDFMEGNYPGLAADIALGGATLIPGMFMPMVRGQTAIDPEDLARLDEAEAMWKQNPSWQNARVIHSKTGLTYVPGTANSFVKEVADPTIKPEIQKLLDQKQKVSGRWDQIFDAPEVLQHEPRIGGFPTTLVEDGTTAGRYSPRAGSGPDLSAQGPRVAPQGAVFPSDQTLAQAAGHETNHGLFDLYGYPGGASPRQIPDPVRMFYGSDEMGLYNAYRASVGEGFSEAMMRRFGWTPEQRAQAFPYDSMERPPDGRDPVWARLISEDPTGFDVRYGWADQPGQFEGFKTQRLNKKTPSSFEVPPEGADQLTDQMFLGPKAKEFPAEKAKAALELLVEGMDPEEIRARTGITFDSAGIPRYEIPGKFEITPQGMTYAKGRGQDPRSPMIRMGTAIDAPELYRNYPELADWPIRLADDGGIAGGFSPPEGGHTMGFMEAYGPQGEITTKNYPHGANMRSVAGHEIMGHGVDYIEGSSFGSMPGFVPKEVRETFPELDRYGQYRSAGGENWANMVAGRMDLDQAGMDSISPYHQPGSKWAKYQEERPRSDQWSETYLPTGPKTAEGDTQIRMAFDPARGIDPSSPDAMPPLASRSGGPYFGAMDDLADEVATPPLEPTGPRRRRAISGVMKTDEELLREAVETPRKLNRAGDYVGAPPGINTPEGEQGLIRSIMDRLTNYNGQGHLFYDEAQGSIGNWTNDPVMGRRLVSSSGHTSNMMSPLPNTNYAVKGMNQYAVGDPVDTGMFSTMQSPKVRESFETDTLSADPKTGPYSYALLPPGMRPADFPQHVRLRGEGRSLKGGAVHDTWDKVAFGYPLDGNGKMPAASDTEHLFMDRIYNKVASMVARNPALRAKYGTGQVARERIQAALWDIARRQDGLFDVLPFNEIFDQTSGFTQMAAIPGPSTGIDPSFLNMPIDLKRQYTDDMFGAFSDAEGGNIPARALGLSPPMREGFGPWQGMMEPNRTIDFAVATNGAGRDKVIDPSSAKAAETMRNWNQFALGQEGSGMTVPRVDGAGKPRDPAATPDLADVGSIAGVPVSTPQDHAKIFKAVEQVFGPGWEDKVVVQQGRDGGLLLKKIYDGDNGAFQGGVREVHKILGGTGQQRMRDVGNDFTYRRFDDGSYRTLMDETRNNPVLKKTFDEKVLPYFSRLQQVSDQWAAKMGLPANTVPDRVRRIFIQAGERWPEAMDEAVRKGIIPAFAATALYEGLYGQFSEDDGGWQ